MTRYPEEPGQVVYAPPGGSGAGAASSVAARRKDRGLPARAPRGTRTALWLLALVLAVITLAGCDARDLGPDSGWSGAALGENTIIAEDSLFIGSQESKLLAIDYTSEPGDGLGELIWLFPVDEDDSFGGIYASPVVIRVEGLQHEEIILVGGYNGILHAIAPYTQTTVWRFETGDSIVGSPALVYEREEATPTPTPTPTPADGLLSAGVMSTPTPQDGSPPAGDAVKPSVEVIIVGSSDGKLYALNAATGQPTWDVPFETGNKIWSTPVVHEGVVYFGSLDHNVYAVDVATGNEKWRFETEGAVAATPLVMNGRVYIGSFDRRFYALDASTGQPAWSAPFEAGNWFWPKAVSDGATIYAASLDGNLYALDAASGAERWRFEAESPIIAAPALVPAGVVVAADDGLVYLVNAKDGTKIRDFEARAHIRAPLTASGSIVYFSAMDHTVRAVDMQGGFWTETWCLDTKESAKQETTLRCE